KRINLKLIVATGGLMAGLAVFSMSLFSTPFLFYIAAIIAGIGYACCATITINTVLINWFHNKLSTVTGVAFSFSGAAGALMGPVFASVIQSAGWRVGYMAMGIIIIILTVPTGLFILQKSPEDVGLNPYGYKEIDQDLVAQSQYRNNGMKNGAIMLIIFTMLTSMIANFGSHVSAYMSTLNYDAATAASVLSLSMISNVCTKLVLGALADKMGTFKALWLYSIFPIIGIIMFMFVPTGASIFRIIAPLCFGSIYALAAVGPSIGGRKFVSDEEYSSKYATASLAGFVGGAVMIALYGSLYDIFGTYTVSLMTALVFAVVVFLMLAFVNMRYNSLKIKSKKEDE
ncbi:MAG: MFS transporter, partial [Faecalicoccus sp.]|nr:MFS transporter [Faecalicoccus sp.]